MTIETQASKVLYVGDGAAVTFPVPFPVHQAEHLRLYLSEALEREIVMETGYSVEGAGTGEVSVTLSAPLPSGKHLAIARLVPLTQRMDLENGGSFDAETIERQFDITEMQIQQLQEQIGRGIKVPLTDGRDPDAFWLELLDASRAALEAYRNTLALADAQSLDSYAVNVRRSTLVARDVPAGGELSLPASYYPKRNILYLAVDGVVCTPRRPDDLDHGLRQYEEIGEDMDALSDRVLVHFPVAAGQLVDVWVITSNHENAMGELDGLAEAAEQSAQSAAASARAAAQSISDAASEAGRAHNAAEAAQAAAQTAGEKAQAADQSAAASAISASAAAASAVEAALAAGGGADAIPDATESVRGKARFGTAAEHAAGASDVAAVPEHVRDSIVAPALEAFAADNLVVATPARAGFLPAGGLPGQFPTPGADGLSVDWEDLPASAGIPSGGIIMWSGAVADIDPGWALCNGQNGTPDLRDKFIVGAGGAYAPGATGGAASATVAVTVGATTLSTSQMPSHSHSAGCASSPSRGWTASDGNLQQGSTGSAGGGGSHTHSGSSGSVSILPPHYALCYIMKL